MKRIFLLFMLLINSLVIIGQNINTEVKIDPNTKITIGDESVLKVENNTYLIKYLNKVRYLNYEIVDDQIIKIIIKSYYDNIEELNSDYDNIVNNLLNDSPLYWQVSENVCMIYSATYEIMVTKNELHTEIIFIDLTNEQQKLLK